MFFFFFFFQAEDGIRDLVRSRGLGDVYKRQGPVPGAALCVVIAHWDPVQTIFGEELEPLLVAPRVEQPRLPEQQLLGLRHSGQSLGRRRHRMAPSLGVMGCMGHGCMGAWVSWLARRRRAMEQWSPTPPQGRVAVDPHILSPRPERAARGSCWHLRASRYSLYPNEEEGQ